MHNTKFPLGKVQWVGVQSLTLSDGIKLSRMKLSQHSHVRMDTMSYELTDSMQDALAKLFRNVQPSFNS